MIAYASVYGGTENAAELLSVRLRERGVKTVMFDVSVTPASEIIAAAFRWSHLVFASATYNAGIFVSMDELLRDLRAALAARFRAAQNSTLTRTAIRSAVLLVLQDYRARGWLSAFGDLRVYADAGDASLCRVEFTYSIPAGLHRIALSAQMTG